MKTSGMARRKSLALIPLSAIACLSLAVAIGLALGLRINLSPSLEMGLYVTTTDPGGQLIEFCPPAPYAGESKDRRYRPVGICPDGAAPLLKPIAAGEGDIVELSSRGISVNGSPLGNTAPLSADREGRRLTPWNFGTYRVTHGQIWVASTYNAGSYDSRYFGPISATFIRNRLRPLWTIHR